MLSTENKDTDPRASGQDFGARTPAWRLRVRGWGQGHHQGMGTRKLSGSPRLIHATSSLALEKSVSGIHFLICMGRLGLAVRSFTSVALSPILFDSIV